MRDYRASLAQLLPTGKAWDQKDDTASVCYRLLQGLTDEFARIDARCTDLIEEADPRTASELVADWAAVLGCDEAQIYAKFIQVADQREAYYQTLFAACGYTSGVTITHFAPMTCVSYCNAFLYTWNWRSVVLFTAIVLSQGDPITTAAFIRALLQLHVVAIFDL